MSELDDKLNDNLEKEKEELRQKSLKYGYKSLTKEEKIQVEYYIQDEVYQEQKELDDVDISNDYKRNNKSIFWFVLSLTSLFFLVGVLIVLEVLVVGYDKLYGIVLCIPLTIALSIFIVIKIKQKQYINPNIVKGYNKKINNKTTDKEHLFSLKNVIESIECYSYREKLYIFPIIFINSISTVFVIIATLGTFKILDNANWIQFLYLLPIITIIMTVIWVRRFLKYPKYHQVFNINGKSLISSFENKNSHTFSDEHNFLNTDNRNSYQIGKNIYNKYTKWLKLDSIIYAKNIVVNVNKDIIFSCKQDVNDYGIILITNHNYEAKIFCIKKQSRVETIKNTFVVNNKLVNSKFYLPTPLKAYLEKKGVDYLNDSRIEFVDNIYEVLKATRKQKRLRE